MGPNGLAKGSVRQSGHHGGLYRSHDLSTIDSKGRETQNAVAVYFNEGL